MLAIIFVVLMCLWLFFGSYSAWDPAKPYGVGPALIPWLCAAILGWIAFAGGPARVFS